MIAHGIMTLVFLILGLIFASGKGSFLIAGYNTMSKEEKAGFDEKKLLKNMSAMMFSAAACMAVSFIGAWAERQWLLNLGFCLIVPCVIIFVIRLNRNCRK